MSGFKGLDTLETFLEIVRDPKQYQEKVAEIRKSINDYKVVVEAVVELSKVNEYANNIRYREEETKTVLNNARQQATNIIADATSKANQLKEEAEQLKKEVKDKLNEKTLLVASIKKQEEALVLERQQLKQNAEMLAKKENELFQLEQVLAERKQKLLNALK